VPRIDYVIALHGEQDHSGAIPMVLEKYPGAKVYASPKCRGLLKSMLALNDDQIIDAGSGDTLSLGDRTLEFIHTPWVHWPETMVTYLREEKILFSCDFFGCHVATSDLYMTDEGQVYEAAKRYYGEIMLPFRTQIQKNLDTLKDYEIEIIAPSHGPLHDRPEFIIDAYRCWSGDEPRNIALIPYISMHGSTEQMVNYLVSALVSRGVTVKPFDLAVTDIGKVAMALVDAATIVIGTPTVLAGAHPVVAYAAFLANALRPPLKFASIIGSYGWGGKAVEQLAALIPNLKVEILPPVLCKGLPQEDDLKALDELADAIAAKHREAGLV